VFVLGACGQAAPAASATAQPAAAAPNPTSTPAPAPTSSPSGAASVSARPSGPCVDIADLADVGDPIVAAVQSIKPALAAGKVDDAKSAAAAASKNLKTLADRVAPASTKAKELFLTTADELTQAAAQFPDGGSLVDEAAKDLDEAFTLAEAARCPS
jgi:hypothetical protein